MSAHDDRAFLLYGQGRYDLAAREFRLALAGSPDNGSLHAMLSLCLTFQENYKEATSEANEAIQLSPDESIGHFALAQAYKGRNLCKKAESAVNEAIRISPQHSFHYSLLASLRFQQEDWKGGLEAVERGLEQDPENQTCHNLRSMALVKLGRKNEAVKSLDGALERDPDDGFSHANQGWAFLHEGKHKEALAHFQEALRLDPNLEFARAGMIEALKAQNGFYRIILGYFLWMSQLSPQVRWGVVLGLFFLQRVISQTAKKNPDLAPYLAPFLVVYFFFVFTTWTAEPLSNLFLRLSRMGNLALSREERSQSNWVGLVLALGVGSAAGALFAPSDYAMVGGFLALDLVLMVIPISSIYSCKKGWPQWVMIGISVLMAALVVVGLIVVGTGMFWESQGDLQGEAIVKTGLGFFITNIIIGLLSSFLGSYLGQVNPGE